VAFVVGTRPNFVKIAPLIAECKRRGVSFYLIHTGQHFDKNMSESFFEELGIPKPDINLSINSDVAKDYKDLTAGQISKALLNYNPDFAVVVGDSDATCAGAMAAVSSGIKLAHIEAGLRSFDKNMPEEVNRIYIDKVSDYLFVTEPSGVKNLQAENISGKIFLVGNVMIDTLASAQGRIKDISLPFKANDYAVATLHRKANVDDPLELMKCIDLINWVAKSYVQVVFPVHPRTGKKLRDMGLSFNSKVTLVDPMGYLEFQSLIANCRFVITDSGGIQDETTYYRKPCLTLRYNTERPITYRIGSSTIVGLDRNALGKNIDKILDGKYKRARVPKLWDGNTSGRIISKLRRVYQAS